MCRSWFSSQEIVPYFWTEKLSSVRKCNFGQIVWLINWIVTLDMVKQIKTEELSLHPKTATV